jgi:multiple sugar transport system permease protein
MFKTTSGRGRLMSSPVNSGFIYLILIAIALAMLLPNYWMIKTSLQSNSADVLNLQSFLPQKTFALEDADVRNWKQFAVDLANGRGGADAIKTLLSIDAQNTVQRLSIDGPISSRDQDDLLNEFNQIFLTKDFLRIPALRLTDMSGINKSAAVASPPSEAVPLRLATNREIFDRVFPRDVRPARRFHWDNYPKVVLEMNFARAFLNSFFVAAAVTFGLVLTSSLAAYAFSRMEFFGRDHLFMGYLATMMVPTAVTMIPVFILLRELGWVNTYWALIVPPMFSAYGVFMLRQFFLGIPKELEEAATLDGCSAFGLYWRIIMPLSKPGLAALAILTFMGTWRSFMWPLIATNTADMFTLPVALSQFQGMFGIRWTLLMTGSIIMIIPMVIAFAVGQRFFIEGIQVGAVKG